MIERKKIFLLLIVFSVFLLSVMAVSAEDISVDTNDFKDLDEAIKKANPDDTIILNKNITENPTEIQIDKNISINGQNNYIDANFKCGIFTISSMDNVTLTLINVTFKNACRADGGFCIVEAPNFALDCKGDVNFYNISAKEKGGVFFLVSDSNIIINNTGNLNINNVSSQYGGMFYIKNEKKGLSIN